MATLSDIQSAIMQLLDDQNVQAALQLNSNTRERAFEVYVFALVLRAVRQAGGSVQLRGAKTGQNPNPLVFRGAPGQMGSKAQDFCYAACRLGRRQFEVHVGVIYLGSSDATHEIDVSLYDGNRASVVRQTPPMIPDSRGLRGAIECKFYDSKLGTALGRTFVGLLDGCGALQVKGFVTNGRNESLALYFSTDRRPQPYFRLTPIDAAAQDRFVRDVEQALRKWAGVT